jgi:hypothetical protein
MSTHTSTTTTSSTATHAGLERVLKAATAFAGSFKSISNIKDASNIVALFGVMALVTVAARELENGDTTFAVEWTALCGIAVLGFWLLARLVAPVLMFVKSSFKTYVAYLRERSNEDAFFEAARNDPRLMREVMAARTRFEK